MKIFFGIVLLIAAFVVIGNLIASGGDSSSAASVQPTEAQLQKAAQCDALLQKSAGMARKWYSSPGISNDVIVTVEVGEPFYLADFETKEALTATFQCSFTKGRMDGSVSLIDYEDWRTHHEVAKWSPGNGLEVEQ